MDAIATVRGVPRIPLWRTSLMSEQPAQKPRYMVSIHELEGTPGNLIFTLVPKGLQQELSADGTPKRVPQFAVAVRQEAKGLIFDWGRSPDDPGGSREDLQAEIAA